MGDNMKKEIDIKLKYQIEEYYDNTPFIPLSKEKYVEYINGLIKKVQIKDNKTGHFYRYCHLLHGSISVNVGDKVNLSTKLAKMRKYRKFNRYAFTF